MAELQRRSLSDFGVDFRSLWGRPLQLIDCQNLFCEVDKYARVAHPDIQGISGRTRIKQVYSPNPDPIEYWYPPKWGINELVEETLRRNPAHESSGSADTSSREEKRCISTSINGLAPDGSDQAKGDSAGSSPAGDDCAASRSGGRGRVALQGVQEDSGTARRTGLSGSGWLKSWAISCGTSPTCPASSASTSTSRETEPREDPGAVARLRPPAAGAPRRGTTRGRAAAPPLPFRIEGSAYERVEVGCIYGGKQIGNSLTDNAYEDDGYRFHDVFHLSYAAMLGWSPILRKHMDRKRRSRPEFDEIEDGGRSTVLEETISALVFNYAQKHSYLDGVGSLDYHLLKTIRELVSGREVESRSLYEWEQAIFAGCRVWRLVRENGGGIVTGDLVRTLEYAREG